MGTKYILKIHLAVILSWLHKMPPDKDSLQTKKDLSASEDYNNSFNAMEKSHSEVFKSKHEELLPAPAGTTRFLLKMSKTWSAFLWVAS